MGGAVSSVISTVTDAVGLTNIKGEQDDRRDEIEASQKKAQETDRAIANEKAARSRRRQRQEAQEMNAKIENMGAVTGMSGSSLIINSQSANVTQSAVNQGQISSNQAYGNIRQADQQRILDAQNAGPSTTETIIGFVGDAAGAFASGGASQAGADFAGGGGAGGGNPSATTI